MNKLIIAVITIILLIILLLVNNNSQFTAYHSQENQDKVLEENVFKNYKNGFFVDVGAHDGISLNNTLFFEQERNWTGINFEPNKSVYDKLVKNRPNCINLNVAISEKNGEAEFIQNEGAPEMLSGLKDSFHSSHMDRVNNEIKNNGGSTNVVKVKTRTLESVFDEYNIKNINYLSIDVEGGEIPVIKSINFNKVFIDVIGFENNGYDNSADYKNIVELLVKNNYKELKKIKTLDIFMIHNDSKFYNDSLN